MKILLRIIFDVKETKMHQKSYGSESRNYNYMKMKKALAGLFGLLGSFGSFPLAGFLPPLVAGAPFLFTASLPSKSIASITRTHKSSPEP
jgi:hypothetical protein